MGGLVGCGCVSPCTYVLRVRTATSSLRRPYFHSCFRDCIRLWEDARVERELTHLGSATDSFDWAGSLITGGRCGGQRVRLSVRTC